MNKYQLFSTTVILIAGSFLAQAQTEVTLTVQDAVYQSLQRNLNLEIARIDVDTQELEVKVAESQFDTTVFAEASTSGSRSTSFGSVPNYHNHSGGMRAGVIKQLSYGTQVEVSTQYGRRSTDTGLAVVNPAHDSDIALTVRQPLLKGSGGQVNRIPIERAKLSFEQNKLLFRLSALDTMLDTEFAYWDLAYSHEVKKVRLASLKAAETLLEENLERERVGLATNIDVLQSEVFVATRNEDIITADTQLQNSQDKLFRNMGSSEYPDELISVAILPDVSTLDPGSSPSLEDVKINNPEYRLIQYDMEDAELLLLSTKNSLLPEVNIFAGVGVSGLGDNPSSSYSGAIDPDGYDWTAGLEFRIPWGQRGDKAQHRQAENIKRRRSLSLEDIELDLQILLRSNWRTWLAGLEHVKASKVSLDLAVEQLEKERIKYTSGLSTFRNILDSQEDLDEANLRYLNSILIAIKSKLVILRLDATLPTRYNLDWDNSESLSPLGIGK